MNASGDRINFTFKKIESHNNDLLMCSVCKECYQTDDYFLQQLINSIPECFFVKDEKSNFLLANNWTAQLVGLGTPQELIGKNDFYFYPENLAEQYFQDDQEVMKSGAPMISKNEKVLINGEIRWHSTTKVPVYSPKGRVHGLVGISRDVTSSVKQIAALKKAKKQVEKADSLKSSFLANLSHEIRTPLNGIIGFSQFLLQKDTDKDRQTRYLETIYNKGQQLLMLINDIIDVSMIESNQLPIKKHLFRINPIIEQLTAVHKQLIELENSNIEIECKLALENGSDKIYTDDFRINQILTHLLDNASKFTKAGKIEIGYYLKNEFVVFYVQDTGIGISKSHQKEIFNRFRQADESNTRIYGGTGLGLAICKGLVKLLSGKIWVESIPGQGSTFSFRIPREQSIKE